jgi:hypothetical protein
MAYNTVPSGFDSGSLYHDCLFALGNHIVFMVAKIATQLANTSG